MPRESVASVSGKRGIVVGTAGHVDHGKTALVHALTGTETDRWPEERKRGLTIDLGFAPLRLGADLETGIIDVPGHEDFLKNMLAGATGINALLLVVAADEGPMPQTREHLAIARLLGVRRGVVALTKRDRADADWLELAQETTRDLLDEDPGTASWPIVPVSATTGEGLEALREALRETLAGIEPGSRDDIFRLPVDRSFSIRGTGTVVTGTVWSGSVSAGERVLVFPGGASARVRGLEVHNAPRESVGAGRRCAVALAGTAPVAVKRGSVLAKEPSWRPSGRLGVRLRSLGYRDAPLRHGQRLRVYHGTREVMARLQTAGRAPIPPGADAWAVLVLEAPLLARARDRAILRFYSPVATIGGIRVAEIDPPTAWATRTETWDRVLGGAAVEAVTAAVELAGMRGFALEDAPVRLGRPAGEIEAAAAKAGCARLGARWFAQEALNEAMGTVESELARLHAADRRASGVSLGAVRSAVGSSCDSKLAEAAITQLLAEDRLAEKGPNLALPHHRPRLTEEEEEARLLLEATIAGAGLEAPFVSNLAAMLDLPRPVLNDLLQLLSEEGTTKAVTPELHISVVALEAFESKARLLLADGAVGTPARFKDAFGLSRKYMIPLLEHLDREGVTQRTREGRVLA